MSEPVTSISSTTHDTFCQSRYVYSIHLGYTKLIHNHNKPPPQSKYAKRQPGLKNTIKYS